MITLEPKVDDAAAARGEQTSVVGRVDQAQLCPVHMWTSSEQFSHRQGLIAADYWKCCSATAPHVPTIGSTHLEESLRTRVAAESLS